MRDEKKALVVSLLIEGQVHIDDDDKNDEDGADDERFLRSRGEGLDEFEDSKS